MLFRSGVSGEEQKENAGAYGRGNDGAVCFAQPRAGEGDVRESDLVGEGAGQNGGKDRGGV